MRWFVLVLAAVLPSGCGVWVFLAPSAKTLADVELRAPAGARTARAASTTC